MRRALLPCMMTATVLACLARTTHAQSPADHKNADPLGDWFRRHHVQIRRAFLTTQDVGHPASVFWVFEPTGSPQRYSLADVAVKVSEWQPGAVPNLLVYPVLEYHLATGGGAPGNKATAAAKVEWVASSNPRTVLSPDLTGSLNESYDFRVHKSEQQYSLVLTPFSTRRPLPGAMVRFHNDADLLRYYLHLGVERFSFYSASGAAQTTTLLSSVAAELDPIPTPTARYLQLTATYVYRRRVGGDFPTAKDLGDFSVALTGYPDGRPHFGLGFEYANGKEATQRFARRERTDIGIRIAF